MPLVLACYYLDEPLADNELQFAHHVLIGPWARFRTGATALQQKRVPGVLPLPDANGRYTQGREERAERICANLRHAGIRADVRRQVLWVAPRDAEWDAVFQFAIRLETGFGPYVVQRWYATEDGRTERGAVRVIDTQKLLRGLE